MKAGLRIVVALALGTASLVAAGCASRSGAIQADTNPRMNRQLKKAEPEVEPQPSPEPEATPQAGEEQGDSKQVRRHAESWGEYYFRKGDFRRAIVHLREDVKKDPDRARLWRHLGSAYGANNDFNNAIACYEAALRRDPKDLKTHYNLSLMHTFTGDLPAAEKAARLGIERSGRHPALLASLGNIYADMEQGDKAIKAYQAALEEKPTDTVTRYNKAAMHFRRREMLPAEEEYRKVLDQSPKDLQAAGNLAAIYILQNRLKEAERLNRWVVKQGPEDEDTLENAYFNLGIIYDRQSKLEKALNMYKLALQVAPWDAAAYVNAAVILERLDRKNEALTYWKKYSRLFPASKRKGEIKRRIRILEQLVDIEKKE